MEKTYNEMLSDKISNCCGATSKLPICPNNTGICGDCGEGAEFHDEEDEVLDTSNDHVWCDEPYCDGDWIDL
jgi:hypothetical protein